MKMAWRRKEGPTPKEPAILGSYSFSRMSQSPQDFDALVLAVRLVMAKWAVALLLRCDD